MTDVDPVPVQGAALETVMIFTTRMTELAAWYREVFDLGDPNESPGHLGFQIGPVYLGFDQVDTLPDGGITPGGTTIWLTVADLATTYQRCLDEGARVRYGPSRKPWGGYLACVYDPDGNLVGLSQRT